MNDWVRTLMGTSRQHLLLPSPLELFEWAVVRQSSLGPGVSVCAHAFNITPRQVHDIVAHWDDIRGHMEILKERGMQRIEAYYNTSGG